MDKYKVTRYDGENKPCAIVDPNGCFYSVGQVDRTLSGLETELTLEKTRSTMYLAGGNVLEKKLEEATSLISDILVWLKWNNEYPTICVKEFIARGDALVGTKETLPPCKIGNGADSQN